jgi:hypothetical protein
MKDGMIYQNSLKDTKSIIHTSQVYIYIYCFDWFTSLLISTLVLEFTARMEAEFILLVRQWRHESGTSTASATASQVDLPSSAPSTPTPSTTNNSQGARKWGNRQLLSQIGTSSTNLNNTTVTTIKRSYPEESDFCYQLDDPNNVSLLPRLPPSHVQLILVRLLDVIQRQIKSGELETPDDWQAQVHH